MDESQPKTLYVGNLDGSVSEDLLVALFGKMGPVKSCKIIREPGNDPYAFIEYSNYQAASTALTAMNKRVFLDKEIKVSLQTVQTIIMYISFKYIFIFYRSIGPLVRAIRPRQTSVRIITYSWVISVRRLKQRRCARHSHPLAKYQTVALYAILRP